MKRKWILLYLDITKRLAKESHAKRLKVGALFVSPDGVMASGINGLPADGDNECEMFDPVSGSIVTKPEVSHAEENLFAKLMRQGVCTKGGTIFITHAPCINCAKIIVNSGVTAVYYSEEYRDTNGVNWLTHNKIFTEKVE